MSWTRLTSITANNGSNIITVNSGSTTNIKVGDALLVEGFDLVEIEGVFASQLQTKTTWKAPTQSNVSAAVVPTFGDFNNAVEEIRKLRQVTTDNLDAMEKWWTQSNGTVTFQSYNGDTVEVRTAQEMDSSVKQIEEAGLESIAEMESQAQAIMTDVTSFSYARTEADMEAEREAARRVLAGSGMIHAGLGHANGNDIYAVNEGLYTFTSARNAFFAGRDLSATSNYVGTSETEFPVFNLHGVAVAVKGLNTVPAESPSHARFILPQAPRGTEVYDSATGVVIDYATEVDPKYGDVAANANEAVARAFEGLIKNSDGRLGTVDFVVRDCTHAALPNGGGFTITPNVNTQYFEQAISCVIGTKYKAKAVFSVSTEVKGTESSPFSSLTILNTAKTASIASSVIESGEAGRVYTFDVEFTATETTHFVSCFFNMPVGVGATATVSFVSAATSSREVVTHPVDLVGFEWFLRPINASDPILYPNGIQQCKLTFVDGITTVENTFRPLTHFEVYPGDTTSRGRGFNILNGSLTDAQLKQQFQKKSNKVFRMSDGTIAQWTLSQRTFRGLGNGDWANINPTIDGTLNFANISRAKPRGNLDTPEYFGVGSTNDYLGSLHSVSPKGHTGIFILNPNAESNYAINNECYFYVVATVPRLNQGGYHPELNPYGTCYLLRDTPGSQASQNWYNSPDLREPLVTKNCFITAVYADSTGYIRRDISGFIGSQVGSARPEDGKFYDGIYVNGMNGIIDWRKPAYPSDTPEQAAKVFQKVISGEYRGLEKGYLCERGFIREVSGTGGGRLIKADNYRGLSSPCGSSNPRINGVYLYVYNITKSQGHAVDNNSNQFGWLYPVNSPVFGNPSMSTWEIGDELLFLGPNKPNTSLISENWLVPIAQSGELTTIDVMGDPAVIATIPQISRGWIGGWVAEIPDGTPKDYATSRKALTTPSQTYSSNGGVSWAYNATLPNGWDATRSTRVGVSYPVGSVDVWHYSVNAFQTKPARSESVLNFHQGILPVWYSMEISKIRGNCLTESLLGQWSKNGAAVLNGGWAPLKMYSLTQIGVFDANSTYKPMPTHEKVPLGTPNNSSIAIKVLPYQVSKNQECSLNFAFSKLVHNGVSWGDNGKMPQINGMSTYTDDNGEIVIYGTATLAIPIGFTKNRARSGNQRLGVDL